MRRISAICAAALISGSAALMAFMLPVSGSCAGVSCPAAWADDEPIFTDTPTPTLKDTLNAGLKARLPQEFQFVDRVVRMVDHGQLPLEMVQSTFLWARRKRIHQFEYFEHGLKMRAEQAGVRL